MIKYVKILQNLQTDFIIFMIYLHSYAYFVFLGKCLIWFFFFKKTFVWQVLQVQCSCCFHLIGSAAVVVGLFCFAVLKDRPGSETVHQEKNNKKKGSWLRIFFKGFACILRVVFSVKRLLWNHHCFILCGWLNVLYFIRCHLTSTHDFVSPFS